MLFSFELHISSLCDMPLNVNDGYSLCVCTCTVYYRKPFWPPVNWDRTVISHNPSCLSASAASLLAAAIKAGPVCCSLADPSTNHSHRRWFCINWIKSLTFDVYAKQQHTVWKIRYHIFLWLLCSSIEIHCRDALVALHRLLCFDFLKTKNLPCVGPWGVAGNMAEWEVILFVFSYIFTCEAEECLRQRLLDEPCFKQMGHRHIELIRKTGSVLYGWWFWGGTKLFSGMYQSTCSKWRLLVNTACINCNVGSVCSSL